MKQQTETQELILEPCDNERLSNLIGRFDEHLRLIEERLEVKILSRGNVFQIQGAARATKATKMLLKQLYEKADKPEGVNKDQIHLLLQPYQVNKDKKSKLKRLLKHANETDPNLILNTPMGQITPRTTNQRKYVENILNHDINFGIGPAGTGKTFLAVACAVAALEKGQVHRILLVRPAVEAGERLGFLPGDLAQKVDPYLRPLYDALHEMLGPEKVNTFLAQQVIEIAPLAYMRGRTLNDAFILLDESQNTTPEQMKMFLTRIGFSSTAVINGDVTQIDLPKGVRCGLIHVLKVLEKISSISFTYLKPTDVIRHPLVQEIINAYDQHEQKNKKE